MAKKSRKSKGIKSSGAKKARRIRGVDKPTVNHGSGSNQSTGKTYLVISGGAILELVSTHNTRYGANKAKLPGQLVIKASNLQEKLNSKIVTITKKEIPGVNGALISYSYMTKEYDWLTSKIGETLKAWTTIH